MDNIKQLEEQMAALQAQIEREKGKAKAKDEVEALAKKLGYTIAELFGSVSASPAKKNSNRKQDKYQNPENLRQRWSGETAKPQWVKDWEASGKSIEECRIAGT